MRKLKFLLLLVVFAFLFGCVHHTITKSGPQGVYHHVKKGETLWSISRAYNVGIQQIAESNRITNISQIKENSVLFIPGAARTIDFTQKTAALEPEPAEENLPEEPESAVKDSDISTKDLVDPVPAPVTPEKREIKPESKDGKSASTSAANVPVKPPVKQESKTASPTPSNVPVKSSAKPAGMPEAKPVETVIPSNKAGHDSPEADRKKFMWPVKGSITSRFGIQPNGMKINGIKIHAPDSAPIVASAAGAVIHSANIKYYGDTVIIKHDDNYSTVYCYLKDRTVKVGDIVKKGDKIALVGKPENGDGKSYLHFEVRYRSKPRDPLQYLP